MNFNQFIQQEEASPYIVRWAEVRQDEAVAVVGFDACGCGCDEARFDVEYPIVDGFVIYDNNVKIPVK